MKSWLLLLAAFLLTTTTSLAAPGSMPCPRCPHLEARVAKLEVVTKALLERLAVLEGVPLSSDEKGCAWPEGLTEEENQALFAALEHLRLHSEAKSYDTIELCILHLPPRWGESSEGPYVTLEMTVNMTAYDEVLLGTFAERTGRYMVGLKVANGRYTVESCKPRDVEDTAPQLRNKTARELMEDILRSIAPAP